MSDYKKILSWKNGGVFHIRISHEPGNIIDTIMLAEMRHALDKAAKDKDIRLIALSADGDHFCYGSSIQEHRPDKIEILLREFHALAFQLMDISLPTLSAVQGFCLGGGLELAALCQFVFAEPDAKFGLPEIKLGVYPPLACAILPDLTGQRWADWLILCGETMSAKKAQKIGIVNRIIKKKNLMEDIQQLCRENFENYSASSLKTATAAARFEFNRKLRKRLPQFEKSYLENMLNSPDAREGIAAFLEKRQAKWSNS